MIKLYHSFRSKVEKSSSLPGHLSQFLMVDHLDSALIMVMVVMEILMMMLITMVILLTLFAPGHLSNQPHDLGVGCGYWLGFQFFLEMNCLGVTYHIQRNL